MVYFSPKKAYYETAAIYVYTLHIYSLKPLTLCPVQMSKIFREQESVPERSLGCKKEHLSEPAPTTETKEKQTTN